MNQQLKKLILLMLIGSTFIGCSLEEDFIKKEQTKNNSIPIVKTIAYEKAGEKFRLLKNNFKVEPYLKSRFQSDLHARTTTQTAGLTIVTDVIKEVTLGDYTSYTMEVISQQDSLVFYNLTMEYKNGESGMFVTKYSPTEFWLNNKNESYQGSISSARLNVFTQYTDPELLFDSDLGNNNHDLGVGLGGSGGGGYSPQGSPYYPTDCGGIVIVSIEEVPFQCGCGDWPWQNCSGCNTNSPYYPGYHQIPYYICQDYGYGNNNPPIDTGGFNGGGPSNPSSGIDTSIAGMIKPEECTEHIVGDLNGDCMLSPYETCLLNGYSQEICDCVEEGGNLADCIDDSDCNTTAEKLLEIFPNATLDTRQKLKEFINDVGDDFGINTKEELCHFLAQAGAETGGFTTLNVTENMNYTTSARLLAVYPSKFSYTDPNKENPDNYLNNPESLANYVYCCQYGNGNISSGDGWYYRGGGILQLTWKVNYDNYKNFLDTLDLAWSYSQPDDVRNNYKHSITSGMWYFKTNVLDKMTITNTTTPDMITKKINPGANKQMKNERTNLFNQAMQIINCE